MRPVLAAVAAVLSLTIVGALPASAATWRPTITLATGGHLTGADSFAASGNTVHVIYTQGGVVYRRSTDGGRTYGSTVRLAITSGVNTYAALSVAVYGNRAAILYERTRSDTRTRTLYVKVSTDGGRRWSSPIAVAAYAAGQTIGDGSVAVTSTTFLVAATQPRSGTVIVWRNPDPLRAPWRSTIVGQTTNREIQNDATAFKGDVLLAAWGNRLTAFWAPDGIAEGSVGQIVQRRSADGGATFGAEQVVASNAAVVVGARPAAVSVFSTTMLLAYQRSDGRPTVLRSTTSGYAWSTVVASPAPSANGNPVIQDVFIGYGGVARLVYASYVGNRVGDKLWVRSSTDGGAHWGSPVTAVGASPTFKNEGNIVSTSRGFVVGFGRYASPSGGVYARAWN